MSKKNKKQNKSKKQKSKRIKKASVINMILDIFKSNPDKLFNYKQICTQLEFKKMTLKQMVVSSLYELKEMGDLTEVSTGRFKYVNRGAYLEGTVDSTKSGAAYIVPLEGEGDVFVSRNNLKNAVNGDTVKVKLFVKRRNKQLEGEVVEIIKRNRETFVGRIEISKTFAFVVTEGKQLNEDIYIPKENLKNAKDGELVVVKITQWGDNRRKNPTGEIIDVLGKVGENNAEIHAILAEYNLPYVYPKNVIDEAEKISEEISQEEIKYRKDFRDVVTFTIDPEDAKDFDDALSVKKLSTGNWQIGVHIADVTHYVKPNSIIDKEGYSRATSIYLVDRVVPMLPERLSNGICSLRPHEEKLCFSVIFDMDDNANILNVDFQKTIIYSDRRFTYNEAQEIIETKKGDFAEEVLTLDSLAKKLRKQRFDAGAIGFERTEVRFNIDENGKPISVFFKEMKDANKLVEEFMLLANKKVAEFIGDKKNLKSEPKTFVYRVHDNPDIEKYENFAKFVSKFGYNIMPTETNNINASLNTLLSNVVGKKEQNIIETLAMRTMSKALYTTDNIGHYGLAFKHYSHFTSPIRRYPDMMVHRLLYSYLQGGRSANKEKTEEKCKHCSKMETIAADAERASIKFKQVEYMQDNIGKEFSGVISGIAEWGIFVELDENGKKTDRGAKIQIDSINDLYKFEEELLKAIKIYDL